MSTPWGDWHGPKNPDGSWVSLDQVKSRLKNSGTPGEFDTNLADLLTVHAHELAQKIRAAYRGEGPAEDNWIINPFDAASLIDPQAGA